MTTEPAALLPAERRARLVQRLHDDGWARVADLAAALGVTPVTVRRDIAQLAEEGVLERVHGGARLVPGSDRPDLPEGTDAAARTAVPNRSLARRTSGPAGSGRPEAVWAGPSGTTAEARTLTIGMVVPSLDYYYPEVIRGARVTAANADVRIILRNGSYDADEVRRQVAALAASTDGLLVSPPVDAPEVTEWLTTLGVPVVLVERRGQAGPFHEPLESVVTDHALGAAMGVRHLAAEGHGRIGLVTSRTSPTSRGVRAGWREAVGELGLGDGCLDLDTVSHRDPGWHDDTERVLDACAGSGTTALLVHADREAISLVERARDRGLRVPEDLAVVAYDDEVAGLADPPITGIRPPKAALGAAALDLLVRRITEPDRPVHRIQLGPQLIVRASSRTAE
ncbi:LacI family DNA-binding transcriptional regulator [Myceligenerans pegani]|uniref:DeoR/GlpR family transcriptional regulator n=1 Tax=Myceligenerans pegani TaxID=2776917 RepID=A0ABR9MUX2_9MICO|nr:substrate-binding domain-containing protein [Myceligenerans sp. TRM 65318]MBE1874734.1 DeoR/GlpR family transcriptional regulator [Myceligenerans sp. TRM 65318]MBE3017005.1 DeoR/GlpR family transcriptional regulator [Myceligenerans sp. TRM 65318]